MEYLADIHGGLPMDFLSRLDRDFDVEVERRFNKSKEWLNRNFRGKHLIKPYALDDRDCRYLRLELIGWRTDGRLVIRGSWK